MNDISEKIPFPQSNPFAASVRLKAKNMSKAYGQRRHDFRQGRQPDYVDDSRTNLNRILFAPRPLPQIRKEVERLRRARGAQRAMKSNAAIVTAGIVTFGHKAAKLFARLSAEEQDAALLELVSSIADRLGTQIEAMVVHLDETSLHAHFEFRAFDNSGVPVSKVATQKVMSELQDLTADVMARHCPGIERGHKKFERIKAGAEYAETLNRTVKQLHQYLPVEIAKREAALAKLQERQTEMRTSIAKTEGHLQKLREKENLNEREANRLEKYEVRLKKKEVEQTEIGQRQLDVMRRIDADRDALIEHRDEVAAREQKAQEVADQARANLKAIEAVTQELEAGTIQKSDDGKLKMQDASTLRTAPGGIVKRLVKLAGRLVDVQAKLKRKEKLFDRLTASLAAFLKRDDVLESTRAEAEGLRQEVDSMPE